MKMLGWDFEYFEKKIRDQLARGMDGTGFDPARDIVAITVNRWPHGYAYMYNMFYDKPEWALLDADDKPCYVGRKRWGRISIGNSDAAGKLSYRCRHRRGLLSRGRANCHPQPQQ